MESRVVISTRAWVYLCLCVFITVGAAGPAGAEPPDAEHRAELAAMRRQIEALRTLVDQQADQIARLSANQEESWMTERRRAEVRELVREVLADTDTRVALLDEGMAAGWDNGFFLASPDDAFLMRIKGMIQMRYTASIQDDTADPSGDDTDTGFGISRTRFGFMGHVIDPSWQYMLWTGFDCKGDAVVLDAYVRKAFDEHLSVTMGQFKLPYLYEYLVSETRLQFVERSLVAGEFCGTYTQGVMVTWQNDWMRLHGSFNDGLSAINP